MTHDIDERDKLDDLGTYETAELPRPSATKLNPISPIVIALLKGVVYKDDFAHWSTLFKLQNQVRDYVLTLNLELILDEAEGYAFLRSRENQDDLDDETATMAAASTSATLPRLVARRPLSFQVSLLLALLRKKLAEFDARGGETRLILQLEEIVELNRIFTADGSNETKLVNQVEANIKKAVDLGFLRQIKSSQGKQESYEVRRILKAFVDAQWLSDFDERLKQYLLKAQGNIEEVGDE